MPLTLHQDRIRGRRRRQDDDYRHAQHISATRRRERRRNVNYTNDHEEPSSNWWMTFHTYMHTLIQQKQSEVADPWDRICPHCHALLLRGESNNFCCNGGKRIIPSLPPLPQNIASLRYGYLNTKLSSYSRRLNNLFSFTAIGVTGSFAHFNGIASVAVTGRVYHRMLDAAQRNHSIHWFLYDERERNNQGLCWDIPQSWINDVRQALLTVNPYVHHLQLFQTETSTSRTAIELSDFSSNGDFAAIIHAGNSLNLTPRNILIWRNNDTQPSFISVYNRHYEPLQYPLLFPHGTPGWGLSVNFTQTDWYRGLLLTDDRFRLFGRLTSEYICDMYCRVEEQRLHYTRSNRDSNSTNDEVNTHALPASFLGSRRWASEQSADGLALARHFGRPSFFITMTCNPDWPEIRSQLLPGQNASDIPVIVARVFKQRLQKFMHILRQRFGTVLYLIKVIEFQKRGLPHAHIIMKIEPEVPIEHIDDLITCRLPEDDSHLREKIKKFMTHNRNHLSSQTSRCNRDGKCIYGFPQPITSSTWIDENTGRAQYQRLNSDEQWIAPHVRDFVDLLDCHIYWDVVFTVHVFMYLYKYMFKGPDNVWFQMHDEPTDEITDYVRGRYLSAPEAAWRIMHFNVTSKEPSVTCLPVHLPNENTAQFRQRDKVSSSASNLIRYFHRPSTPNFDNLTYTEYYEKYVQYRYNPNDTLSENEFLEQVISPDFPRNKICPRKRTQKIARLKILSPTAGEAFYLRALLMHKPARSYEDLKIINNTTYQTFHEAAIAMGIFMNINEGYFALQEAILSYCTPSQVRFLFARIILEGYPARPLWDTFNLDLSLDYRINTRSNDLGLNLTLQNIASFLLENRRNLSDFGLPLPDPNLPCNHINEIVVERTYFNNTSSLLRETVNANLQRMTEEQRRLFQVLLQRTHNSRNNTVPIFIEGKPGRGKTFLINTFASHLRSNNYIVLIAASSAIAASLYDRGQTAHSLFKIPVNDDNINIPSNIQPNTNRANLIKSAKCIIWDEFPLANRAVIESVSDICQKLFQNNYPFGGIPFIAVGDFRQVAPVANGQGVSSLFMASIKSSALWNSFEVLSLHRPIRSANDIPFTTMIDTIGDDYTNGKVNLSNLHTTTSLQDCVDFLFPTETIRDVNTVWKRAFLSPLNIHADEFNTIINDTLQTTPKCYYSADIVKENNECHLHHPEASPDYLAMALAPGVPPHKLELKTGSVCTIMRNMSIQKGLVKNAKVLLHKLGEKVIEVRVINNYTGILNDVQCLPRIRFDFSPKNVTWTIQRLQFPLRLAYATTFHSCLGATLDKAVLDLRTDVFTHGQLYTACSRVRCRNDILILKKDDNDDNVFKNVVYRQLLL